MGFSRVSRQSPCPICGKPDWCLLAEDGRAAICARVESAKPVGQLDAGWLHLLGSGPESRWRRIRQTPARRPLSEIQAVHRQCLVDCQVGHLHRLALRLRVTVQSLHDLRVGYSHSHYSYSFPMRDPDGQVIGIRYRTLSGAKWSESGSREGIFFRPDLLGQTVVIVEGATDAAALMSLGCQSVIGRASCISNAEQLKSLCRARKFNKVVIVPDSDLVGIGGARRMGEILTEEGVNTEFVELPAGMKDCRQCLTSKQTADWLAGQIGAQFLPLSAKNKVKTDD